LHVNSLAIQVGDQLAKNFGVVTHMTQGSIAWTAKPTAKNSGRVAVVELDPPFLVTGFAHVGPRAHRFSILNSPAAVSDIKPLLVCTVGGPFFRSVRISMFGVRSPDRRIEAFSLLLRNDGGRGSRVSLATSLVVFFGVLVTPPLVGFAAFASGFRGIGTLVRHPVDYQGLDRYAR
jgi:hypothetical protein